MPFLLVTSMVSLICRLGDFIYTMSEIKVPFFGFWAEHGTAKCFFGTIAQDSYFFFMRVNDEACVGDDAYGVVA